MKTATLQMAARHRGRRSGGLNSPMDPDNMRPGRTLMQGDLRVIALSFIAEAPCHGYGIIKLVEEKTAAWYSPSPGIVYPTLTCLERAGYVITASAEGSKKTYAITPKGRDYLKANRDLVETVVDRLTALGELVSRWRRAARGKMINRNLPPLVEAAFDYLRETVSRQLEDDAEAEGRLVEIIARAGIELQRR